MKPLLRGVDIGETTVVKDEGVPPVSSLRRPSTAIHGDPASGHRRLSAMFQQNFTFIWRMLRRLGLPEATVDDAAQQVFLVSTRKLDAVVEGSERAFLLSTAMRVAAEVRRSRAIARESPSEDLDLVAHPALNPEELTQRKHSLELLDRILEELPVELRMVFVLFELDGMSKWGLRAPGVSIHPWRTP
jgi:RNA polymerase sigma-70 factor, ECF subfamily